MEEANEAHGLPTDDWRSGLRELESTAWGRRTALVAIGIGDAAHLKVLNDFAASTELAPIMNRNARQLVAVIRWASTVPTSQGESILRCRP
ncbi:hypothetical protein [Streptomyces sp. YGL11-2]|uniref:hypothetical protein n=1 Tax=Streptomyces sp. YGL11-2 TaxID=3414028 RepID=UPI003CE6AAD7